MCDFGKSFLMSLNLSMVNIEVWCRYKLHCVYIDSSNKESLRKCRVESSKQHLCLEKLNIVSQHGGHSEGRGQVV